MQWICQKFHTTLLNLVQNAIGMNGVCSVEFSKNPHHTNDFSARDRNQSNSFSARANVIFALDRNGPNSEFLFWVHETYAENNSIV